MTEVPIFEKFTLSRKKGKEKGETAIDINDSPFSRLEEGKEMSILDHDSLNAPKVQQLVLMIKEWINNRLAKENIVVRDIQEDLFDGQIIHKIMQLEDPTVPFFAEVVQSPAHQRDKIKSLIEHIEAKYRRPSEFSWTAEQIHSKDFVAIVRLLVTLISHFDPNVRFPENVTVTCNRYVRSNGAVRPLKAHLENLSSSTNQQTRDAFDTMFEQAPEKLAKTKRQCLAFVNGYLDRLGLSVTDIERQLSDGFLLLLLLGMLGDFFVPFHACHQTPTSEAEKLVNVRLAFELMRDMDIPLKRVSPEDVVSGDAKALVLIFGHRITAAMGCMSYKAKMYFRIGMGVSGVCTGISVFFAFLLHFHSYHAAYWGITSGVFAAIVLAVNVLEFKNYWKTRTNVLFGLLIFGIATSVIAAAAFVTYVVLAIVHKEGIIVYGNSLWMGSVWSSMTLKWTGMLAWFSWTYYKQHKYGTVADEKKGSQEMTSSSDKAGDSPDVEEKEPMVSSNASEKV